MKEEEWRKVNRPYEIFPKNADCDDDQGWHITTCDICSEVIGFEQYPPDGDMLCVECGLKMAVTKERKVLL